MMAPPQKDGAAQPSSGSATQKPGKMGSAYQSKEDTRTKVQQTIAQKVKGGGISSDDDLQRYIADTKRIKDDGKFDADDDSLDLSLTSLKMVPLSVWKQLR